MHFSTSASIFLSFSNITCTRGSEEVVREQTHPLSPLNFSLPSTSQLFTHIFTAPHNPSAPHLHNLPQPSLSPSQPLSPSLPKSCTAPHTLTLCTVWLPPFSRATPRWRHIWTSAPGCCPPVEASTWRSITAAPCSLRRDWLARRLARSSANF